MVALDSRLEGRIVCVRESMRKFASSDVQNLEICNQSSRPIPLYLNQQMIKIMEDMGVDHKWFFDQQIVEVERLKAVTARPENASRFLEHHAVGSTIAIPKFLLQLERMGIDYRRDPFLRGVVEAAVLKELRLVKHKSRIPVRKGVTLFGIMDETGYLKENEVYVTYDTTEKRTRQLIDSDLGPGRVLVTRSPSHHPGDIQTADHVVPPKNHPLRDLENCIVFSQQGQRDLPSKLSGGDLDGDLYHIIWDWSLFEDHELTTFPPAEYPAVISKPQDRPVSREDMTMFFVNFMKNDQLGPISVRHKTLADHYDKGTLHSDCLELAKLASDAVDYSKTGKPVDVTALPKLPTRSRPDL